MSAPKPILLGYQAVRIDTPPRDVARGRRQLECFAQREGYALGEVYIEKDMNHQCSAMAAVIAAAHAAGEVTAIAVPTRWDLGTITLVQVATRQRIERESGVSVKIVFSG